jgi:hypothetical protein
MVVPNVGGVVVPNGYIIPSQLFFPSGMLPFLPAPLTNTSIQIGTNGESAFFGGNVNASGHVRASSLESRTVSGINGRFTTSLSASNIYSYLFTGWGGGLSGIPDSALTAGVLKNGGYADTSATNWFYAFGDGATYQIYMSVDISGVKFSDPNTGFTWFMDDATGALHATNFIGSGAGLTGLPATNLVGTIPGSTLPAGVLTNNQVGPVTIWGDARKTNSKTFNNFGLTVSNGMGQSRLSGGGLGVGTTTLPGPGSATFTNNVTAASFTGNHIGNLTSTNLQMAISTNNIVPQAGGYSLSTAIIDTNRFILTGADLTNANCTYVWFVATNGYTNSTSPLTIALATNGLYIAVSNSAFGYRTNLNTNAAVYIATASRVGQWVNGYNAPTGGTNGTQQAPVGSFAYTNGLTLVVYVSTDGTNQTPIMSFGTNATVSEGTGKASGNSSHAEGGSTTASGLYSHAEGNSTTASGLYSHAEGGNTTASGSSSHAEGGSTTASGSYSHAGGQNSKATNFNTFVWSDGTVIGSVTSNTVTFYVTNGYRFGGGAASFDSSVSATNGFASYASNALALTSITFPATTVNWTNTFGKNIMLFIDNTGVTGTAAYINGSQIFGSILPVDFAIPLQAGEYFSETYTVGTPTAKWKPF